MLSIRYRIFIFIILCLLLIAPLQAQEAEALPNGVTLSSDAVTEGYILFSPMQSTLAYLIDNAGRVVHQWQSEYPILMAYLLDNGDLLVSVMTPRYTFSAGGTGRLERYDWENNLLWSYELNTETAQIHHDFALMPNGNMLLTMWELLTPDAFADWGLDPALVPEDNLSLFYDRIIELDPTNNEIVWEWRLLEHSVQDYDESLPNYGIPAENPQRIDLNYSHNMPDAQGRSHFNAIEYNADLDQIMVSAHFLSEIWIIEHQTGDLVYRWGNPQAYGRGLPIDRQLFNHHNPSWLDNGNILIFNNGSANFRRYSNILEIIPPLNVDMSYTLLEGARYAPIAPVWEYRAEPQESFFAQNMSGAQRLPNGNTFITDAPNGRLFEIDTEGAILWEYMMPIYVNSDPIVRAAIFRAIRYLPNYPAFSNRDLTPSSELAIEYLDA